MGKIQNNHNESHQQEHSCHSGRRIDYLLWGSLGIILPAYIIHFLAPGIVADFKYVAEFTASVFNLLNKMWWGVALGIFFVGLLSKVPREFIISALGNKGGLNGILRATMAGVMLDLCSHGILLVGMKLYERGASLGQLMAFLIASPWNSLSLTFILWSLVGLKWTLIVLFLSMFVAIISGLIFEKLVENKILPKNPNRAEIKKDFKFFKEAKRQFKSANFSWSMMKDMVSHGASESTMILRWIFFGVVLASLIRTSFSPELFQTYFGPTLAGLGLTIIAATIIEVCSEGSTPIAADLMNRAHAPGNMFTFLMTGVSTDYTEIMALKETTRRWKIALFLPLITVPQIVMIGWLLNIAGS